MITAIILLDQITGAALINKYKMYGIFGLPGSGKSTYMQKLMYKHIKQGWIVYYDDYSKIPGVKHFDGEALKKGEWLPDGRKGEIAIKGKQGTKYKNKKNRNIVLFFDEMGLLFDSRQFRTAFTPETLNWWKKHRHYRIKIYYGSQSWDDMDLKIRVLTDQYFLCERSFFKNFTIIKPIIVNLGITNGANEQANNDGGKITKNFQYEPIIFWKWLLLRKWISKFNSFGN